VARRSRRRQGSPRPRRDIIRRTVSGPDGVTARGVKTKIRRRFGGEGRSANGHRVKIDETDTLGRLSGPEPRDPINISFIIIHTRARARVYVDLRNMFSVPADRNDNNNSNNNNNNILTGHARGAENRSARRRRDRIAAGGRPTGVRLEKLVVTHAPRPFHGGRTYLTLRFRNVYVGGAWRGRVTTIRGRTTNVFSGLHRSNPFGFIRASRLENNSVQKRSSNWNRRVVPFIIIIVNIYIFFLRKNPYLIIVKTTKLANLNVERNKLTTSLLTRKQFARFRF